MFRFGLASCFVSNEDTLVIPGTQPTCLATQEESHMHTNFESRLESNLMRGISAEAYIITCG